MESQKENGLTVLWIDDNGFMEKKEEIVFNKSMRISEFILMRSAPLHHPPHKVRAWLSLLKNSTDYRDHFTSSKLLDKKMTFEQLEISPGAIILLEKQSIDSNEWFLDKLQTGQTVVPDIVRLINPEPGVHRGISPHLYTLNPIFPDKLTPTPTQSKPTQQPMTQQLPHAHFDPMTSQIHFGHMVSQYNPSNIPFHDHNPRHRPHHPGYTVGGLGSYHEMDLNLVGEDKQIQEVILKSIQQAKIEEDVRKEEEKKQKEKEAKIKEVQDFLNAAPQDKTDKPAQPVLEEWMVDEPEEEEYNEDFDYVDEGDAGNDQYYEEEVQDQDPVETDH